MKNRRTSTTEAVRHQPPIIRAMVFVAGSALVAFAATIGAVALAS